MGESPAIERQQLLFDPTEIAARPRHMLQPGVDYTMLWREDRSVAGLMFFEPGAAMAEHTHEEATHHLWVVDGAVRMGDRVLGAGSYGHVPARVPHDVEAVAPGGATLFYLYLRPSG